MEIVSALLGHSTMSVTQDSYAKIVNKKIAATMAAITFNVSAMHSGPKCIAYGVVGGSFIYGSD
jgi:hypothetical protein